MTARVLVAYAASTGFDASLATRVASEVAAAGVDVDVRPLGYAPTMVPYAAVYLGWAPHSRPGRRDTTRFLRRNAAVLPHRRIWVVHRQPGAVGVSRCGPVRLSRLVIRHGCAIPVTSRPLASVQIDAAITPELDSLPAGWDPGEVARVPAAS